MPKGPSTPGTSMPARQETEDVEARALASVADALDAHNKSAAKRKSGAGCTPSDGECRRGEKYTLYMEVERDVGIGRPVADRALPSYAWNEELIRDHMDRVIEDISDSCPESHGMSDLPRPEVSEGRIQRRGATTNHRKDKWPVYLGREECFGSGNCSDVGRVLAHPSKG